jgi:hypothetical protein
MRHIALYFLLHTCLLLTACKEEPADPVSQLPPATTTGENTFGCLVNGEVWTPKGRSGGISNLTKSYDYGTFNVTAYRVIGNKVQRMGFGIADILQQPGIYHLNDYKHRSATFKDDVGCSYLYYDSLIERNGTLNITRLDLSSGVIAGTFEFILIRPDCDTIRVTEGRFDLDL